MSHEVEYQTERLDHLGILAGVCQEAGRAEWLDTQAGENRRSVSFGKATVAMVLNGLGFSNRQLYLVPQYFENKPVEHVLGAGITADRRERSTVWGAPWIGSTSMMSPFYLPDWRCQPVAASALPQTICISIRPRSRKDGDYTTKDQREPAVLAITYGYSRDHREDLKQWMLALANTHEGDVPIFLRPLDGTSSDKEHLSAAVKTVMTHPREQVPNEQEQRIAVFDRCA